MRCTLPCCGHEVEYNTELRTGSNHVLPKEGDVTVCYNCGSWLRHLEEGGIRQFVATDMSDFSPKALDQMRRATRLIKRRGRLGK